MYRYRILLSQAIKAAGVKSEFMKMPNKDHFNIIMGLSNSDDALTQVCTYTCICKKLEFMFGTTV